MDRWPLVGRSSELSQLTAAVVARRGALITGPAWDGKTTLTFAGMITAINVPLPGQQFFAG